MNPQVIRELRRSLTDKPRTLELAKTFINEAVAREAGDACMAEANDSTLQVIQMGLSTFYPHGIDVVYKFAESEIEKIFLNSLLLWFLKLDPFGVILTQPPGNTPAFVDHWREQFRLMSEIEKHYPGMNDAKGSGGFIDYITRLREGGKLSSDDFGEAQALFMLMHVLGFYNSFTLTMQAPFPNLVVDGRSLRADIYIWIPSDKGFNLIVECDGYEHHSTKESFIRDRRRDRVLKANSIDVLRFSGAEIFNDPVQSALDLFQHLKACRQARSGGYKPGT